jgi:hypothetical protein
MTKEEIIDLCNKEIDILSLIFHEKKLDTGLVSIESITPIITKYINLAYDYGSLNGQQLGRTELLNSIK